MMGGIFDQVGGKIIAAVGIAAIATFITIGIYMTKSVNIPQELLLMNMRIQQLYSGAPDYSGLDNATAMNAGIVPQNLIKGTSIKNSFGGDITITPGSGNETFTFTITNIPKSECVNIANNKMNAWLSVTINGSVIADNNVSAVANACTDKSTLVFETQ